MSVNRWQNLVHRKCPKCDSRLELHYFTYKCPQVMCRFAIGKRKIAEILTDETHVIHRFMSPHERRLLEQAVTHMENEVESDQEEE